MKIILILAILILTTFGCSNKHTLNGEKLTVIKTVKIPQKKKDKLFRQVADFPTINDSAQFITELRRIFELEVFETPVQEATEKISTYKKVKLFGSENDYIFIEYDYVDGCSAAYPWRYQLLLTTEGKLIKILTGQRFDFVTIFPNQNPFLLTVISTAKGNGGHELYKITDDTLENIYEGYYDYKLRTYDADEDNAVNEPNELTLKVKDYNKDGFNDISFSGKILFIHGQTKYGDWYDVEIINGKKVTYSVDTPFRKIPVEYIFLYDKQTGHFKEKENYIEKYGIYD